MKVEKCRRALSILLAFLMVVSTFIPMSYGYAEGTKNMGKSNVYCVWTKEGIMKALEVKSPIINKDNQNPIEMSKDDEVIIAIKSDAHQDILEGKKLEKIEWKCSFMGDQGVASLVPYPDFDGEGNPSHEYQILTALKPGKVDILLETKVNGFDYELKIPVLVKGNPDEPSGEEEPQVESKLERVDFTLERNTNFKILDAELNIISGQRLYIKPVVKSGVNVEMVPQEADKDKLAVNRKEDNGAFRVKAVGEGKFSLDVKVDGKIERTISINVKHSQPIVIRQGMRWVQVDGPYPKLSVDTKGKSYTHNDNVIEEKIGNMVYLKCDIPAVPHLYEYDIKVEDIDGILDRTILVKDKLPTEGLQYKVVKSGRATVTVKCDAGEAEYVINVAEVKAEKVEIINAPTMLEPNKELALQAKVTPHDATDSIVWSIDKTEIADISQTGKLTPKKEGVVKVTAKVGNVEDVKTINIKKTNIEDIYFDNKDTGEKIYVENGEITLKMTDFGTFHMEGEKEDKIVVEKWDSEEYVHHPERDEYSYWFWVDRTNRFHPRKVGEKEVILRYTNEGNHFTKKFKLKVIKSDIEEIRSYAVRNGEKVYLGKDELPIAGSERVNVVVEGRKKGETDFKELHETSYELEYKAGQHIIGSSFKVLFPGKHTVSIRMLDDTATLNFDTTSSYVKQTGFEGEVPATWEIHDWNSLGDAFVGMRYNPMEEVEQYGSKGYTLRVLPRNASYSSIKWESLNPDVAVYDPLHANGLVPKKPGKATFIAKLLDDESITKQFTVEFKYRHELKKATVKEKEIKMTVNGLRDLKIDVAPQNASEQRFRWTYEGDGEVLVADKVNTDPNDVNVEKWTTHNLIAKKAGTVKVTGVPFDETGDIKAKTIEFVVHVAPKKTDIPSGPAIVNIGGGGANVGSSDVKNDVKKEDAEIKVQEKEKVDVQDVVDNVVNKAKIKVRTVFLKNKGIKVQVELNKYQKNLIKSLKAKGEQIFIVYYRSHNAKTGYKKIKTTQGMTYIDDKVTADKQYFYKAKICVKKDGKKIAITKLSDSLYGKRKAVR